MTPPRKEDLPGWCRPGKVRLARWDGGPLELCKNILTGYETYNPPNPDLAHAAANWLAPETIAFIKEMHYNWVWVNFSVGFTDKTEYRTRLKIKEFIKKCHRENIKVSTYISLASVFLEDMYAHDPEIDRLLARDDMGTPIAYGSRELQEKRMGRFTRAMACLCEPEWLERILKRVKMAVEIGADGIEFDNNFSMPCANLSYRECKAEWEQLKDKTVRPWPGAETFDRENLARFFTGIYRYAKDIKKDIIFHANIHGPDYCLGSVFNALTSEDGQTPGFLPKCSGNAAIDASAEGIAITSEFKDGYHDNLGTLKYLYAISEGWRPICREYSRYFEGTRFTHLIPPKLAQLSIAETAMYSAGYEAYPGGEFLKGMFYGESPAKDLMRAIGEINGFLERNEELYTDIEMPAEIGVFETYGLGWKDMNPIGYLQREGLMFDVILPSARPGEIKKYKAVYCRHAAYPPAGIQTLMDYVSSGGKLLLKENSRLPEALKQGQKIVPADWDEKRIADELLRLSGGQEALAEMPAGVVFHLTRKNKRIFIHLVNYNFEPVGPVKIKLRNGSKKSIWRSPDFDKDINITGNIDRDGVVFKLLEIPYYSLLIIKGA